ncbi:hypothetical protein Tco_0499135 [Tanacetum coccineum]
MLDDYSYSSQLVDYNPQHEVVQRYDAILPDYLTNPAMKESEAYKTYHDLATGKVQLKPKYVCRSYRTKTDEAPKPSFGKRVKATAKVAKSGKKKQPTLGLETLSDIALTEAEQMKLAIKRSKTQLHQLLTTAAKQDEEVNEEDSFDPRVQTPSHDVNVNLEGRDTMMTDAPLPNVQATQETEDAHVILTAPINPKGQQQSSSVSSGFVSNMLNPRPDTGIDSIFNLNTEATSLVDVPVTTIAEPPLVFATTLPPPPTHLITHMQQTPVPTPTIVLSSSLQDLSNFGSLFEFDHRLKTLETKFSEFKQMNQFADSSIPDIVDAYLANKMNEAVKPTFQLQIQPDSQMEAQVSVSKILPRIEKTVNEQLEVEVMTRSTTESKTSLAIAANLSELELKKILIEKKISRDDEDKDEEPCTGSNRGCKRKRARKEPESTSAPKEKTSKTTGKSTDGSKSQHKSAGATEEQSDEETSRHPDWFQKPAKIPTPDHDWNKTLPAVHGPVHLPYSTYTTSLTKTKAAKYDLPGIEDMLTYGMVMVILRRLKFKDLISNCKMTNLNVEDRLAFGVSLRMFTRSIIIQRRVEDLQLGVESYQKKLNITKLDTYISDLKRKDAYTIYSNPRGFIYLNKDKKNILMLIDKLHKFSDGTLDDVRTALND